MLLTFFFNYPRFSDKNKHKSVLSSDLYDLQSNNHTKHGLVQGCGLVIDDSENPLIEKASLILQHEGLNRYHMRRHPAISEIDDVDIKIIKSLLNDSRKKFIDIAKECGISVNTAKHRYSELKKSGIIKGSTLIVDVKKLGYEGYLSLYVKTKFDEVDQFLEYANKLPGVMTAPVSLNENYTAHVLLPIKAMKEIELRKDQVKNHPSVIDVKANIWTEIISFPENLSM